MPIDFGNMDPRIQREPLTLDVAIQRALAQAQQANNSEDDPTGAEHQQLAAWLQELQDRQAKDARSPQTITEWQQAIHQYALDKGWYDNDTRTFGDMCALFHSEISEAYEEYRNGHAVDETYWKDEHGETFPARPNGEPIPGMKPEGVPSELADVIIRILDSCERAKIDLQSIMEMKHAYNLTRSYRHGGKRT